MGWKDSVWEDFGNPEKPKDQKEMDESFYEAWEAFFRQVGRRNVGNPDGWSPGTRMDLQVFTQQDLEVKSVRRVYIKDGQGKGRERVTAVLFGRISPKEWRVISMDFLNRPVQAWTVTNS